MKVTRPRTEMPEMVPDLRPLRGSDTHICRALKAVPQDIDRQALGADLGRGCSTLQIHRSHRWGLSVCGLGSPQSLSCPRKGFMWKTGEAVGLGSPWEEPSSASGVEAVSPGARSRS